MRIGFYYQNWQEGSINGTQDSVSLLCKKLAKRDIRCSIIGDTLTPDNYDAFNTVQFTDSPSGYARLNGFDAIVALSSLGTIKPSLTDSSIILWNHCWDYVEGVDASLDTFESILALSPKHAKHLKADKWCYNGYDPEVFNGNRETECSRRNSRIVLYCGGPEWYKGFRKLPEIEKQINGMGYELRHAWRLSHEQLANQFNMAGYVLIPSEAESFCQVSVQAQACGCIPLAHDVGGVSETMPTGFDFLYRKVEGEPESVTVARRLSELNNMATADRKGLEKSMSESVAKFDISETSRMFLDAAFC